MHRFREVWLDTLIGSASMLLVITSGLSIAWAISNGRAVIESINETVLTSFLTSFTVDVINLGVAGKLAIRDKLIHFMQRRKNHQKLSKKEALAIDETIKENKLARNTLIGAYIGIGILAVTCNLIYAFHKVPDNAFIAIVSGILPFSLITVCTIVLRTIPLNYEQLANEAINDTLISIVNSAKRRIQKFFTMRRPSEVDIRIFAAAIQTVSLLGDKNEAVRFQQVAATMSGQKEIAAPVDAIDVTAEDVLNAQDVADKLQIPLRTAQYHLSRFDKSSKIGASFYIKKEDLPDLRAKLRKPRAKQIAPPVAGDGETTPETQLDATNAQQDAITAQLAVNPA